MAGKESPMTEIHDTLAPFVEAEIKEHNAVFIREMVVVVIIICAMLMLIGTASLIIDTARSLAGLLTVAFESLIVP